MSNSKILRVKNLMKLAIVACVFGIATNVSGQYLWLKGGLNSGTQIAKDNQLTYSDDFTNRIGFHAGVIAGAGVGPIAGEGGILVSTRGYNYSFEEELNGSIYKFSGYTNLTYIDVPLNLKLRARLGGSGVFLNTGPVFSFGIGGKAYSKTEEDGVETSSDEVDIKWGDADDSDFKQMDIGYALGAGVELGKISLSAQYIWGLTNLATSTLDGEEVKNRTLQFTLGFQLFDL